MKKIFAVIIVILALPLLSQACDTCGCNVNNRYTSILPDFRNHVLGLRYRYSSLNSYTTGAPGTSTFETYNSFELWGGWNITHKIRVMASIPYRFEELNHQAATMSKNGLGDISLLVYYKLLDNRHIIDSEKSRVQNLWFGAGVETPTGKYEPSDKNILNGSGNLYQLGSGSTDVIFNVVYNLFLRNWELDGSTIYKINTVNKDRYEYGNYFNVKAQAYYKFYIARTTTVAPDIGLQFENFQHSVDNDQWVKTATGNVITGTVGVETNFKGMAIGGSFQIPLKQNLGKGIIDVNNTYVVHVAFTL